MSHKLASLAVLALVATTARGCLDCGHPYAKMGGGGGGYGNGGDGSAMVGMFSAFLAPDFDVRYSNTTIIGERAGVMTITLLNVTACGIAGCQPLEPSMLDAALAGQDVSGGLSRDDDTDSDVSGSSMEEMLNALANGGDVEVVGGDLLLLNNATFDDGDADDADGMGHHHGHHGNGKGRGKGKGHHDDDDDGDEDDFGYGPYRYNETASSSTALLFGRDGDSAFLLGLPVIDAEVVDEKASGSGERVRGIRLQLQTPPGFTLADASISDMMETILGANITQMVVDEVDVALGGNTIALALMPDLLGMFAGPQYGVIGGGGGMMGPGMDMGDVLDEMMGPGMMEGGMDMGDMGDMGSMGSMEDIVNELVGGGDASAGSNGGGDLGSALEQLVQDMGGSADGSNGADGSGSGSIADLIGSIGADGSADGSGSGIADLIGSIGADGSSGNSLVDNGSSSGSGGSSGNNGRDMSGGLSAVRSQGTNAGQPVSVCALLPQLCPPPN